MFRFWYRFIPENISIISRGASDLAYNRIKPCISDYMGEVFEEICKQYLWSLLLNCIPLFLFNLTIHLLL